MTPEEIQEHQANINAMDNQKEYTKNKSTMNSEIQIFIIIAIAAIIGSALMGAFYMTTR